MSIISYQNFLAYTDIVANTDRVDSSDMRIFIYRTIIANNYFRLKSLFPSQTKTYLVSVKESSLAILRPVKSGETPASMRQVARMIVDTLNMEALTQVHLSYSSVIETLAELSGAFKETSLALKVGKLFYPEQTIFPYNELGIGRLIREGMVRRTIISALSDLGMKEPFPLDIPESEMEKVRRNRYFALSPEEENSLEEFAWAFGSDAVREIEKQVKSIVEQIHGIPDLEQLSQAGLEEKLQYWHSLGPLDEDELLRRLELHIDDFPDELKENSALAVRLIERRRRVLRDRILREHPNIREHLKEKRNILEQRLQKQNPDGMQKLHNLENQNR